MADKIMLIRHAEKPEDTPPPFGVDENGTENKEELSARGWQRAGALTCLFGSKNIGFRYPELASPQTIFATSAVHHNHSLRPQHTVAPLAALLGFAVITEYPEENEAELVEAATKAPGPVLIVWHHGNIPVIADLILGNEATCPQHWPEDRFDMIWVFDRTSKGWHFLQVPQRLLAGDSDSPIITANA